MYIENQEKLYEQWFGLVIHVIHKKFPWAIRDTGTGAFRKVRRAVDVWDLKQEGWKALLAANENFNPELGTQFKTYAYRVIYNQILNYLDKNSTPITTSRQWLVMTQGSPASQRKMVAATNYVCFSELSSRGSDRSGMNEMLYSPMPNRESSAVQNPAVQLEEEDFHQHCIEKLKKGLTGTEYRILLMRYNHETYAEIGRKMDLSTERIRQILEAANYKVRSLLYEEIETAGSGRQTELSLAVQQKLQRPSKGR